MGLAGLALAVMRADGRFGHLRLAVAGMGLAVAAGCGDLGQIRDDRHAADYRADGVGADGRVLDR
jgi:hypothetical protein